MCYKVASCFLYTSVSFCLQNLPMIVVQHSWLTFNFSAHITVITFFVLTYLYFPYIPQLSVVYPVSTTCDRSCLGLLDTITSTAESKDCPGVCVHTIASMICDGVLEDVCPSPSMKCCLETAPNTTQVTTNPSPNEINHQTSSVSTTSTERPTTTTSQSNTVKIVRFFYVCIYVLCVVAQFLIEENTEYSTAICEYYKNRSKCFI